MERIMENKKEDRRIRKTKKLLTDSLAALLAEKPLKSITVRELAEIADINRGTFYLHYRDVYDMVDKLETEAFERFNEIINSYEPSYEQESFQTFLTEFFEFLADNSLLAKCLIGRNGDAAFVEKLKAALRDKYVARVYSDLKVKDDVEFAYLYHFIEMGSVGICEAWLNGGMKESPRKIAEITENMILSVISSVDESKLL